MNCKNCEKEIPHFSPNQEYCSELCDIWMKISEMKESDNSLNKKEKEIHKNTVIRWIVIIWILFAIWYFSNNPRDIIWLIPIGWVLLLFYLAIHRLFWIIILFFWWLASCFSMVASIIFFQILWAIWFFILMCLSWGILSIIKNE